MAHLAPTTRTKNYPTSTVTALRCPNSVVETSSNPVGVVEREEGAHVKRILLLLAVAALVAAMMVTSAFPALADPGGVPGHCTEEGILQVTERCAGGGPEEDGGGGGGITETTSFFGFPIEEQSTGGGSNFRGTEEGGGGQCTAFFGGDLGCQTGKLAER